MESIPGQFVTDELGRIIVSYSSLKAFRACRRKYFWRYLRHLVPLSLRPGDPRDLGKAVHAAREGYSRGMNVDDVLLAYWGDVERDHTIYEERERSRAMMRNYRFHWGEDQADHHGEWVLLETQFQGDIEHPQTGEIHRRYAAGGKVDGALKVTDPCLWGKTEIEPGLYLYELKTASRVDETYIRKLWLDFQILWYSHYVEDGLRSMGHLSEGEELRGVLYDVAEKTKLAHREGELEAEYEARYNDLMLQAQSGELRKSEKGGTLKRKQDEPEDSFRHRCIEGSTAWVAATCKRIEREPDERYQERLDAHYLEPSRYHRELVPISLPHRENVRRNVWELLWQHDEAERRDHWGQNEDQCFGYFRPCDYLPICQSLDSEVEIENNFRVQAPHSEQVESDLPIVEETKE